MKLVQLKRQAGDGDAAVVAAVGPLEDAEADSYATQLRHLVGERADLGLSVGTTDVQSASGDTAEPPAGPAELLRAVLGSDTGTDGRGPGLPEPDART